MCRHLAYLGPPIRLARLLFDAPHSLEHQAWAPREMRGAGTINADGFGLGWYPDPAGDPVRHRRDHPIWTDSDLRGLAAATQAPAALAAVRSATPGMPAVETACAPFTGDGWLFSLNGRVADWPDSVAAITERLPAGELLAMDAPVDSAWLWALVRHRLRTDAEPARAVAATVAQVAAAAPGSRLNLLLANPHQIVASTAGHALSVRADEGSVLVSSEPLDDDPGWQALADGVLLVATLPAGGRPTVSTEPIATDQVLAR